jgi:hypothetical protein
LEIHEEAPPKQINDEQRDGEVELQLNDILFVYIPFFYKSGT